MKAHDEMVKTSWVSYSYFYGQNLIISISVDMHMRHSFCCETYSTKFQSRTASFISKRVQGGLPPSIPTAKTVTVARVASRISTNRIYQQALLQSLKDYFDRSKRLISQGDLLAVPVDIASKLDTTDEEAGEVLVNE